MQHPPRIRGRAWWNELGPAVIHPLKPLSIARSERRENFPVSHRSTSKMTSVSPPNIHRKNCVKPEPMLMTTNAGRQTRQGLHPKRVDCRVANEMRPDGRPWERLLGAKSCYPYPYPLVILAPGGLEFDRRPTGSAASRGRSRRRWTIADAMEP